MQTNRQQRADEWRDNNHHPGGVVIFFEGRIQGWVNMLRDPQQWQPGCIAVDEVGDEFIATGGDSYAGSERWVQTGRATQP